MRPLVIALVATAVIASLGIDLLTGASRPGLAVTLGLGGCMVIIIGSKWLGQWWLSRPEAYYDDDA